MTDRERLKEKIAEYTQHKVGCASLLCQFEYGETNRCNQPADSSDHDSTVWPFAHAFIAGKCTCGLDTLLASREEPIAEKELQEARQRLAGWDSVKRQIDERLVGCAIHAEIDREHNEINRFSWAARVADTISRYRERIAELEAASSSPVSEPTDHIVVCSRGCRTPQRDPDSEHPGVCICGGYLRDYWAASPVSEVVQEIREVAEQCRNQAGCDPSFDDNRVSKRTWAKRLHEIADRLAAGSPQGEK